jgi:chromosomal replication initiation ATPase DnaA
VTPREKNIEMARKVAEAHGVALREMFSPIREGPIVRARWDCWARLHSHGLTAKQIGRIFDRDHSTVLHGLKRASELQLRLPLR